MLTRYKTIAIQLESQEGVLEPLPAASDVVTVIDPNYTPDFQRHERNTSQGSLTMTPDLAGSIKAQVTFGIEVAGATAGLNTPAPLDLALRACGHRVHGEDDTTLSPYQGSSNKGRLHKLTPAASWTAGTQLDHGTAVTQAISGAAGVVVGTYFEGDGEVLVRQSNTSAFDGSNAITGGGNTIPITAQALAGRAYVPYDKPTIFLNGTPTGSIGTGTIVTGLTSGAKGFVVEVPGTFGTDGFLLVERLPGFGFFSTGETVQLSAGNNIATIAAPQPFDIPALSISLYEDGEYVRLSGCRGTAVASWPVGKPGLIQFTFEGNWNLATGAIPAVAAGPEAIPPIFFGANMQLDGSYSPLISELGIDFARSASMRPDANAANGWTYAEITARQATMSIDPEAAVEAGYAYKGKAAAATRVFLDATYGTGGTGNAWHLRAPNAQFQLTPGDREGQYVYELAGKLFGQAGIRGDEYVIANF